jgi:hypothetical protein
MRRFLILTVLFVSCNYVSKDAAPEPSNIKVINLQNGLGTVSVFLPVRYDTTFTWIHYSDCGRPCEKRKYRVQPKTLPLFQENGYRPALLHDSVEQFTIVHNPYIPAADIDNPDNQEFITLFHDHKKYGIIHDPDIRVIKSDTIEKIGDRYFSIIVVDKYDTAKAQYSKKLLSTTTIKKGTIDFNFELLTKQKGSATENFIDNAKYYLRTIRINFRNKLDLYN